MSSLTSGLRIEIDPTYRFYRRCRLQSFIQGLSIKEELIVESSPEKFNWGKVSPQTYSKLGSPLATLRSVKSNPCSGCIFIPPPPSPVASLGFSPPLHVLMMHIYSDQLDECTMQTCMSTYSWSWFLSLMHACMYCIKDRYYISKIQKISRSNGATNEQGNSRRRMEFGWNSLYSIQVLWKIIIITQVS